MWEVGPVWNEAHSAVQQPVQCRGAATAAAAVTSNGTLQRLALKGWSTRQYAGWYAQGTRVCIPATVASSICAGSCYGSGALVVNMFAGIVDVASHA